MSSKFVFFVLLTIFVLPFGLVRAANEEKYIIWPVPNISGTESDYLARLIAEEVTSPGHMYAFVRKRTSIPKFWTAILTNTAFEKLRKERLIRDIHVNAVIAEDEEFTTPGRSPVASADFAYATQIKAPIELRVISQPKPQKRPHANIDRFQNYVYSTGHQSEAYIYHVEFGIDPSHPDFSGREIEWLYTPLTVHYNLGTPNPVPGRERHSMCTASKAAGTTYGAARLAKLVIVKMPNFEEDSVSQVISTITDHIKDNERIGRSVVSISWSSGKPVHRSQASYTTVWQDMEVELKELTKIAAVFCAARNHALKLDPVSKQRRTKIDTAPAILGHAVPVGNCDNNGKRMLRSQHLPQHPTRNVIYGPGYNVQCAESTRAGFRLSTGTSQSTALVAGTVADLLASGQLRSRQREESFIVENLFYAAIVEQFNWKRDSSVPVIWNGVTATHNPPFDPILRFSSQTPYNLSFSNSADA